MYIQFQNFGGTGSIKSTVHQGTYERIERIHQFPEIILVKEGEVEITVDGVTETARGGDLAVITPFRAHSFHTPVYCDIWIGVVSSDFAADFLSGNDLRVSGTRAVFTPSAPLYSYVLSHLPDVYEDQTSVDADRVLYRSIKALVFAVLEEYTRTVPQDVVHLGSSALVECLCYLAENYTRDLSLESVATYLGYAPTYLSHCISSLSGLNFRKLLNSLRVDHAKNLLVSTDLRLIDVALESGFSGERSFFRAFSELVGTTPAAYRGSAKRNAASPRNEE